MSECEMVTVSKERLVQLEALEAKLKKKNAAKHIELQKYTDTPIKKNARVMRHIDKDRDAYNARRRERRRLAKEAAAAEAPTSTPALG